MKRRRHTPEQIVRKLREADWMLGEGTEVPEVAKALEVSEATYHRWRAQFGLAAKEAKTRTVHLTRRRGRHRREETSASQPVRAAPGASRLPDTSSARQRGGFMRICRSAREG